MNTETKPRSSMGRIPGGKFVCQGIHCDILAETHDGWYVVEYSAPWRDQPITTIELVQNVTPDNPESLRETLDDETWLYLRDTKEIPRALLVLIAHARTDDWAKEHLRGIRHMIDLELQEPVKAVGVPSENMKGQPCPVDAKTLCAEGICRDCGKGR